MVTVEVSDQLGVKVPAVRSGTRITVLIACFRDEPHDVRLPLPAATGVTVRFLHETTFDMATTGPNPYRARATEVEAWDGRVSLHLRPFAAASIVATGIS